MPLQRVCLAKCMSLLRFACTCFAAAQDASQIEAPVSPARTQRPPFARSSPCHVILAQRCGNSCACSSAIVRPCRIATCRVFSSAARSLSRCEVDSARHTFAVAPSIGQVAGQGCPHARRAKSIAHRAPWPDERQHITASGWRGARRLSILGAQHVIETSSEPELALRTKLAIPCVTLLSLLNETRLPMQLAVPIAQDLAEIAACWSVCSLGAEFDKNPCSWNGGPNMPSFGEGAS